MTKELIEEVHQEYFEWLVDLVDGQDHQLLLYHLHQIPYIPVLERDENRAEDGASLRDRYEYETSYSNYDIFIDTSSVLEMLIGLSVKMNDLFVGIEEDDRTYYWFWEIMTNLKLDIYVDNLFIRVNSLVEIDEILETFLNSKYDEDGQGGLFPLRSPEKDQRKVEIWYQMSAYIDENYNFG